MLETSDTSVRRLDKLEEEIGLPVLATVPRIFDSEDFKRHRVKVMATAASLAVALVLTAAFAMLAFNGVESTLELIGYDATV